MIHEKCFTAEWLQAKTKELKAGDPGLLERAVYAFALLGHLAESGLDFVFKGGTSLLLHIPVMRRLSIDIDILCSAPTGELDRVLSVVSGKPPFLGYGEDKRGVRGLPHRRHFKFVFQPVISAANFVLLDVVEEKNVPHDLVSKTIAPPFLEVERDVRVQLPTVESLLADKLGAFAPRTIGVPFEPANGQPAETMQIVKQLFDVGELFSVAEDLTKVRRTYQRVFDLENVYRGGQFSLHNALEDTLGASLCLCRHRLRGVPEHNDALQLEDGMRRLTSHLVNTRFSLDNAKVAAAKASLLTRLISKNDATPSLSFWRTTPNPEVLRPMTIDGEWERLNRLKPTIPEGFYYWYQASRL